MRISDWSSDVCSSDLQRRRACRPTQKRDERLGRLWQRNAGEPPAQTSKRRHHDGVAEHRSTGLCHYYMSALTMVLCNFDQYDGGSEQNHERQCGRDHDERAASAAEWQKTQGQDVTSRIGTE